MDYKGKKVALTGVQGFIGYSLFKRLEDLGAYVNIITGDVRQPESFNGLDYEYDYLFHFAAPSSQILFKRQPLYAAEVTIKGFINAAKAAKRDGIKLIYPSTGLLSQERFNEYAMCKKICEDIHLGENLDATGIRIFATYGPGESHKRDFASVPYLFARDMANQKAPVIFGDGEQVRDFIYIDDVVESILHISEEANEPIIDVGSGEATKFNDIIKELKVITTGPDAVYVEKPGGYVTETLANPETLHKYYVPRVNFAEGIARTVKSIKGSDNESST